MEGRSSTGHERAFVRCVRVMHIPIFSSWKLDSGKLGIHPIHYLPREIDLLPYLYSSRFPHLQFQGCGKWEMGN